MTGVEVFRFPNALCTDNGRAINMMEPGWENTLTGLPKEMYSFWDRHLRPIGYKVRVQVVDFSGGVPGDIALTLKWAEQIGDRAVMQRGINRNIAKASKRRSARHR